MVHVNYGLAVVGVQFSFKLIFWVFNLERSANFAILCVPKYQIPYHVLVATLLWKALTKEMHDFSLFCLCIKIFGMLSIPSNYPNY